MYVEYYNGAHSMILNGKHTWEDWHLIPEQKPIIPPPALREKYVDIPGANGQIDLTEALTGHPTFHQRTGSVRFLVDISQWSWEDAYTTIMNELHGRQVQMVLTDEPDWYYIGRVTVNSFESGQGLSRITLNYNVSPFRYSTKRMIGYDDLTVNSSLEIEVVMPGVPAYQTPVISSTAAMTLTVEREDGYEAEINILAQDNKQYYTAILGPGVNTLTFTGNGKVSLDIRRVSL